MPQGEGVKTIPLGEGLYAYVDAADYEWLNQWHWRVCGTGTPATGERTSWIFMHREIMKPPKGKIVDHISGNKLDNTRANLRNITPGQNMHNKAKCFGSVSIYKGVNYDKKATDGRRVSTSATENLFLGRFDNEVEAARAYDCGRSRCSGSSPG